MTQAEFTPLPVAGYTNQSQDRVELVNANKALEERVLRAIDQHKMLGDLLDQRCVAIAYTHIQDAFMWLNRSIFQPQRISLPEDTFLQGVQQEAARQEAEQRFEAEGQG